MLRSHLKFFVDPESVIQVEMCVAKDNANIHVVEPLGQLIQAVLQVHLSLSTTIRDTLVF